MFCVMLSATSGSPCQLHAEEEEKTPIQETAQDPIEEAVEQFCLAMQRTPNPVLARPPECMNTTTIRRPRRKQQPVSSPRRSLRLAKGPGCRMAGSKQQCVLIRRLCLANEAEVISKDALQMYARLFSKPLSDSYIAAILALFGWEASALPLQEEDLQADARQ